MNEFDNVVFLDQGEYDRYLLGFMRVERVRVLPNGSANVFFSGQVLLPLDWLVELRFVVREPSGKFDVHEVGLIFQTGSELVSVIQTRPVGAPGEGLRVRAAQVMTGPSVFVAARENYRVFPLVS